VRLVRSVVTVGSVVAAVAITGWTVVSRTAIQGAWSDLSDLPVYAVVMSVGPDALIIGLPWLVAVLAVRASERDHRRRRAAALTAENTLLLGEDAARIRPPVRGDDLLKPFDGEAPPRSW
jgi:hypothetical protein